MRRSRRVYQAPDDPDTSMSDTDGCDLNRKRNTNNDPSQPLTGPRLDSVADHGEEEPNGDDRLAEAESGSDSEAAGNSSFLTRYICCCRRRTDTKVVGETAS